MHRDKKYRIKQKERVIKNRKKLMRDLNHFKKDDKDNNRYNKRHPYDCGVPGCLYCHSDKVFEEKKMSEARADDSGKEQIREELEDQ